MDWVSVAVFAVIHAIGNLFWWKVGFRAGVQRGRDLERAERSRWPELDRILQEL